jgi:hypothetical protein
MLSDGEKRELIAKVRAFASASYLGKQAARELDKAILTIRRLADALESSLTVPDGDVQERLADWLGEQPEAYNVRDITDEATTVIQIGVEDLSTRLLAAFPILSRDIAGEIEDSDGIEADMKALYPWTGRSIPNMRVQEERLSFKAGLRRAAEIARNGR